MPDLSSTWLALLSAVIGGYAALLRHALVQKNKIIEENDLKLAREIEILESKMSHVSSKQSELSSELRMQELRHENLLSNFKELREVIVTKAEFDTTRRATQETLQLILFELRKGRPISQQFYAPQFPTETPKGK